MFEKLLQTKQVKASKKFSGGSLAKVNVRKKAKEAIKLFFTTSKMSIPENKIS